MTTTYGITLFLHSWLRWAFLIATIVLLVRTIGGARSGRAWDAKDERAHTASIGLLDLQFLLGVLLYAVLSPISRAFFTSPLRMKDATLRFFGVEHLIMMLAAVAVFHIGRSRSKKVDPARRHATVRSWSIAGLVLLLAGIPWPFFPAGRPLFRGFGFETATSAGSEEATPTPGAAIAPPPVCPPVYAARCASCHGEHGRGDGVAAGSLTPRPRDFAEASMRGRSDAELLAVIRDGGSAHGLSALMPPGGDLPKADLDGLIGCIRSFQK